ncbi:hypothetical protein Tdes44962_MAKER00676 [Teratosphaeria destructans]|uniref:Uncharacterized protein n=1 Tax=Teratosphaeria destructans TaxID=418781 RepID=A0A9W7W0Y6_9PEZI|nr:hypothetical protein Tdes44962_MAKER00676 [Teratosphaeria destructans]
MSARNGLRRDSTASIRDRRPSLVTQAHFENLRASRRQRHAAPPLAMLNLYEHFIAPVDCRCPSCRVQTNYGPHVLCENRTKSASSASAGGAPETLPETTYEPRVRNAKKERRKSPVGEAASKLARGIKRRVSVSREAEPEPSSGQGPPQPEALTQVVYSPSEVSSGVISAFEEESSSARMPEPRYAELVFHANALLSDFDVRSVAPTQSSPRDSVLTAIRDGADVEDELDSDLAETTRRLREISLRYGGQEDEEEYPLMHFEHEPISRRYF